jgi:type VI secretion system secreted protein Hcp
MSTKVYLTIRGVKQGTFKGGSPHHDDWIEVLSFTYSVESPRDASTGQASGKRQYSPIKIVKEWGAGSP